MVQQQSRAQQYISTGFGLWISGAIALFAAMGTILVLGLLAWRDPAAKAIRWPAVGDRYLAVGFIDRGTSTSSVTRRRDLMAVVLDVVIVVAVIAS